MGADDGEKPRMTAGRRRVQRFIAAAAALMLLWHFLLRRSATEDDLHMAPSGAGEKKRSLGDNVDFIEASSRTGFWAPNQPVLVLKRPPRECSVSRIAPQVFDPLTYVSKQHSKWNRRAFSCLRGDGVSCRAPVLEDFEDRRWKGLKNGNVDATFVLTDSASLKRLRHVKPAIFQKIYYAREGTTYLNALLGAEGLGGTLVEQFAARQRFTRQFGCDFNDLQAQLPRYRPEVSAECEEFEDVLADRRRPKQWVHYEALPADAEDRGRSRKSEGKGQRGFLASAESDPGQFAKFSGGCNSVSGPQLDGVGAKLVWSVMEHPLYIQKQAFDVRSYMLIGSTMPFMVFFRRGYIRRSSNARKGSASMAFSPDHFDRETTMAGHLSLDRFGESFADNKLTGTHWVDTFLQSSMKQIAKLVFHATRTHIERRRGSFQLFSVDFRVDDKFGVYLEKTSGYPDLPRTRSFDTAAMIAEMHDLVQEMHEEPVAFESMTVGDKYGGWELIFSELAETCTGIAFNPCHAFIDFNSQDLRKANHKISAVHNAANRKRHEETRIVKKSEEFKKNMCRTRKVRYPSSQCDKLLNSMREAKFKERFAEHENSFNRNSFKLPKPGEVFPHETV